MLTVGLPAAPSTLPPTSFSEIFSAIFPETPPAASLTLSTTLCRPSLTLCLISPIFSEVRVAALLARSRVASSTFAYFSFVQSATEIYVSPSRSFVRSATVAHVSWVFAGRLVSVSLACA